MCIGLGHISHRHPVAGGRTGAGNRGVSTGQALARHSGARRSQRLAGTNLMGQGGRVSVPFPEPTEPAASRAEVLLRYLDFFRFRLVSKLEGMPPGELRASRLPSGWAPIELIKHLRYVELRWLEWGFEGRDLPDAYADVKDGRWYVGAGETLDRAGRRPGW